MNKNMPVAELELDDDTATILKVMQTYELDFLPIGIDAKTGIPNKKELNEWWFGRSIPASRLGIRTALEKLSIQHSEQLLLRCYGLSLSDQYWMKPVDSELEWKNIDGKRYLIKAGSNPFMQEPINEVFGTRLHQRLGCKNYVSYNALLEDGIPYSVCENFVDTNTELVNAVSINRSMKKRSQYSSYKHFMNACEKLGIPGMKEFIDEERIEVLSKAVTSRVEELQEMELEQKKQFTLGSLQ